VILWIFLSLVLFVGAVVAGIAVAGRFNKPAAGVAAFAGVGAVWVFVTLLMSFHTVGSGEVGVVYRFGKIVGQRDPGVQILPPWESLSKQSIKVQKYRFQKAEGQGAEIIAFSSETQDVYFDVTLNYSLDKNQVQTLFKTVGPKWFEVLVPPRVHNFFKEETVAYTADQIAPHREEIRQKVKARLSQDLAQYSITVNDLLIDNLDFSKQYKQAIEDKQAAKQAAQEAEAKVATATAQANQVIEKAKGDAEAVKIAADAQASANAELAASLTDALVQYTYIQKLGPDVRVIITDGRSPVIVNGTGTADAAAAAAAGG
jgi:regulator of protease activity HflC (stomatin/prohibitin superfamily)